MRSEDRDSRFFFLLFVTISKFSTSWTVQEGPGRLLGGVLGGSWGVLRGSGGVRGASWEALWRLWSGLGGHLAARRFLNDFRIDFRVVLGAQKGAKREPKRYQNRTKIEGKNDVEKRCFSRPSWSRLGAILGHFGGHLGGRKSVSYRKNQYGSKNPFFRQDKRSRGILD